MSGAIGGSRPGASLLCRRLRAGLSFIAAACVTGCGSTPPLEPMLESPAAVAQAVVQALELEDLRTLEQLAVNEHEFQNIVWPRQPGARPERNLPWTYAWRDLAAKSRAQLRTRLNEWPRQRRWVVERITFDGETTDYQTYRVMRKSRVTLRDASGRRVVARLFGSIIEQRGRYKVFSYVAD
jgi:hypothetical protein